MSDNVVEMTVSENSTVAFTEDYQTRVINAVSPTATVSKSGSTAMITITDINGTTTAEVNDGEPGDPSELIDDTAGSGDTDKVWSADKTYTEVSGKYEKPSGGIPSTDLASGVTTSLGKADTAYQKPSGGIPGTDLADSYIEEPSSEGTNGQVLTTDGSGGRSWTTVQGGGGTSDYSDLTNKPSINSVTLSGNKSLSDLGIASASDLSGKADKVSSATNGNLAALDSNGNLTDSGSKASDFGTYSKPSGGIPGTDLADSYIEEPSSDGTSGQVLTTDGNGGRTWTTPSGGVSDVQVNGTSVVSQGVANVPLAENGGDYGLVKFQNGSGGIEKASSGNLRIATAMSNAIKAGTETYRPIVPARQHESVFYGLSKLAGEDLTSDTVTVGTYPEKSLSAISQMLNAPVSVSGSTPSITAKSGVRYICGEVSTLSITAPASGCIDVVFESGSTATVLTVTSAKTGVTAIKWVGADDPTALEANKTYEVNILDGEYGVIASWT